MQGYTDMNQHLNDLEWRTMHIECRLHRRQYYRVAQPYRESNGIDPGTRSRPNGLVAGTLNPLSGGLKRLEW
jgi:hypothetical protein